ncbi:hypothetical protein ACFOSC_20400 [Streptantibioticus rubrisoli]|uniref:Transposase n=1 Tax=Streptantibioticus rubrisoli TaxID=1387313 RepID=A0ABT1PD07_9ACTN|nr:transposase [Streptantibioticus rubrisoli]MCQ4043256.1 transposase [Streptantibioticus rubrisoli]
MRVVLVRDNTPRTRDRDDRGYGLPLVTTDLTSTPEELVARYAARWCIELAFFDARQTLGVGQARNRTRRAVERTVQFGLLCLSLVIIWYTTAGYSPADAAEHGSRSRWYTTKAEPSFGDMAIKLRRVLIADRFRPSHPDQATPEETRTVLAAWVAAEHDQPEPRNTRGAAGRAPQHPPEAADRSDGLRMLQESRSYVTSQQITRSRKNPLAASSGARRDSGELAGCRTTDPRS